MKLSIVIPAYNEEKLLPDCLASVRSAAAACGLRPDCWELIVCDNASTDATARLAREAGALVVQEGVLPHLPSAPGAGTVKLSTSAPERAG